MVLYQGLHKDIFFIFFLTPFVNKFFFSGADPGLRRQVHKTKNVTNHNWTMGVVEIAMDDGAAEGFAGLAGTLAVTLGCVAMLAYLGLAASDTTNKLYARDSLVAFWLSPYF